MGATGPDEGVQPRSLMRQELTKMSSPEATGTDEGVTGSDEGVTGTNESLVFSIQPSESPSFFRFSLVSRLRFLNLSLLYERAKRKETIPL